MPSFLPAPLKRARYTACRGEAKAGKAGVRYWLGEITLGSAIFGASSTTLCYLMTKGRLRYDLDEPGPLERRQWRSQNKAPANPMEPLAGSPATLSLTRVEIKAPPAKPAAKRQATPPPAMGLINWLRWPVAQSCRPASYGVFRPQVPANHPWDKGRFPKKAI